MTIRDQVRNFILTNFLFTDDQSKLEDGQSLMQSGAVDSTGIMELILFVDQTFGVTVEDDEMVPENLDSVDNVVAFLERKQA